MQIGKHFIFDGYCNIHNSPFSNAISAKFFLRKLTKSINMTAISAPSVHAFPELHPGPFPGMSGFIVLAESHCSFHTFPEKQREGAHLVSLDVYSCADFEDEKLVESLKKAGFISGNITIVNRFSDERSTFSQVSF